MVNANVPPIKSPEEIEIEKERKKEREKQEEQNRQKQRLDWANNQSATWARYRREGWTASDDKSNYDTKDSIITLTDSTLFEKGKIYDHKKLTKSFNFGILYDENGNVSAVPPGSSSVADRKARIDAEIDFVSAGLGHNIVVCSFPARTRENENTLMYQLNLRLEACKERGLQFELDPAGPFLASLPADKRIEIQKAINEVNLHAQAIQVATNATNPSVYNNDKNDLNQMTVPENPAERATYKQKAYEKENAQANLTDETGGIDKIIELADKKIKVLDNEQQKTDKIVSQIAEKNEKLHSEIYAKLQLLAEPEDALGRRVKYLEPESKWDKVKNLFKSDKTTALERIGSKEAVINDVEAANNKLDGARSEVIGINQSKATQVGIMGDERHAERTDLKKVLRDELTKLTTKQNDAETKAEDKPKIAETITKLEKQIKEIDGLDKKAEDSKKQLDSEKAKTAGIKEKNAEMTRFVREAKENIKEEKESVRVKKNS